MDKFLLTLLASILGVSVDKLKPLAEAEDGDGIETMRKAYEKGVREDGHKKGVKLISDEFRAKFAEKFGVTFKKDATVADMITVIEQAEADKDPEELSEDAVKASEAYKALQLQLTNTSTLKESEIKKRVKEAIKLEKEDWEKEKRGLMRSKVDGILYDQVLTYLKKKGAILPDDEEKVKKRVNAFIKATFANMDIEHVDDDFTFKENGAVIAKNGAAVSLDDLLEENAPTLFDFKVVQQRESSGLPPRGTPPAEGKKFTGAMPKNEQEFRNIQLDYGDGKISGEAFKEVKEHWQSIQK